MSTQFSSEQLDRLKSAMEKLKSIGEPEVAAVPEEEQVVEEEDSVLSKGTYLKVDDDEMAAWLYLTPPKDGEAYKKSDLIDYLERHGVVEGLHQSNLSAMIKKKVYNREILVAVGRQRLSEASESTLSVVVDASEVSDSMLSFGVRLSETSDGTLSVAVSVSEVSDGILPVCAGQFTPVFAVRRVRQTNSARRSATGQM